jgi:hypothetical protein
MQNEGECESAFHIYLKSINIKVQMKINAAIISERTAKNVNSGETRTPNFAAKNSNFFTIKAE